MLEFMLTRPQGIADQLDSMHRLLARSLGVPVDTRTIRSVAQGSFPEVNVGRTGKSIEVFAFAPGLDAASIDVTVERNVLKISAARDSGIPRGDSRVQLYANERPAGRFTRAITLPDDVDTSRIDAKYRDGVLRVSIALAEAAQPQRITVQ